VDNENAIVPADCIGIVLGDNPSREEKKAVVLKYISGWLDNYKKDAESLLPVSKEFSIVDDTTRKTATAYRESIRAEINDIAAFRKKIFGPSKKDIRDAEALFNSVTEKLEFAKDNFDEAIKKDYLDFEDARKAAQDIANLNRDKSDDFTPDVVLPETEKTVKTESGSTSIRKDIKVSIADKMTIIRAIAECKLPLILADIDIGASKRFFKASGLMQAPGFKIEEDAVIAGRK
jgi:hypothetical protein